jgi:hypothetical protein
MSTGRDLKESKRNKWVRKMKTIQSLLNEMDRQKNILDRLKAFFPYMNEDVICAKGVRCGGYCRSKGLDVSLQFSRPITKEDVIQHNELSRWLNESFIICVFALIESHKIYSNIDKGLEGSDEIDILKRLRMILAHSLGKYHSNNSDQRKLVNRIITHMGLEIKDPVEFPLDIDKVIDPLVEGCKKYIKAKSTQKG